MTHPARERAGGRVVLFLLLGLVVLFGGGYAAAYAVAGDNLPRGTRIEGVEIGGLTQERATRTLRAGLVDQVSEPILVTVDGQTETVLPSEAGLAVDYAASVAAAGGGQGWHPARLWDYYTGSDDLAVVVTVDDDAMAAAVERLYTATGRPARDGRVGFEGRDVLVTEPRPGGRLDPYEAAAAIEAAYLQEAVVELTPDPEYPAVDDTEVQRALDRFANPAVSGAVTLVLGDARVRLRPDDFGDALGLEARNGRLVPALDQEVLLALVDEEVRTNAAPVDARFRIVDGKPKVVPAKTGVRYDPGDVADAFLDAVTQRDDRRVVKVRARVARADLTTKGARRLGIKERVSTFTTYYPDAEYRNVNIGRAAEIVSGTVLEPGEVFSLNGAVGERTRANGFTKGFVIEDGIFKEDFGGGVSQIATTTFNAMFFAGLEDVEHKPHSFYIDRYPVGREATVAWGSVDLRFRNSTPYGVLITASVAASTPSSSGVVTVSMWSTDHWDITASASDRYHETQPETRTLRTEDCYPNEGYAGFDIDVTRVFRRAGRSEVHHREGFHTRYTPSDTVVCLDPRGNP